MKAISILAISLFGLFIPTSTYQTIPDAGRSHPAIEADIDRLVRAYMADNVPGMTVSISKNGRMVINKAYGYSNYENKSPMLPYHRSRIGSVSKVVTALGVMKMTEEFPGFDLRDRVYTEEGPLAEPKLVRAITRCVQRYRPVVAMAIAQNGNVYTWYADKKLYIGTATDLDAHQESSFSLPPGKTVNDIRAIAISPNSNKAFTWYDDGSLSSGTPSDLDKYFHETKPYTKSNGEKDKFKKADGKTMDQIVGIAMGKNGSQTRTYTWYDDGTVSIGDARNLVKYAQPAPYSTSTGESRYDIRGMGMTADNHVFTWFSDKKMIEGTFTDLDKFRRPASYTLPPGNMPGILEQTAWRVKTEVRHLLSHTSGIKRNFGDADAVRAMFNLGPDARLTDLQVQTYVLSTQKLLFDPGSNSTYSNRGLGFCSYVVSKVSGKPYGVYLRDQVFKPLGLDEKIVPNDHQMDRQDSRFHGKSGNQIVVLPWETDPTGYSRVPAAGGWASSAGSLIQLLLATDKLTNHPDILRPETIDLMETKPFSKGNAIGWGRSSNSRGVKLSHNGSVTGGKAYMAKYLNGFTSAEGYDMGNINVAVCANTDKCSLEDMEKLASDIAKVAARNNIPVQFDLVSN
ncbi:MAG: serine hydrolase domain-containing protein [Saprospiraceae bacterium]